MEGPIRRPHERRESFAESRIRMAIEAGAFERLQGAGKPIPDLDEPYDPMWWLKKMIRRENLEALPKSLALRNLIAKQRNLLQRLPTEDAVRQRVEQINATIRELNAKALDGPGLGFAELDPDEALAPWRARRAEQAQLGQK